MMDSDDDDIYPDHDGANGDRPKSEVKMEDIEEGEEEGEEVEDSDVRQRLSLLCRPCIDILCIGRC